MIIQDAPYPERKHTRIPAFDYSQPGYYFVTICTNNRICCFGSVDEFAMNLSALGRLAQLCWLNLPQRFPNIDLDKFVIMPNHIHGIVQIQSSGSSLRNIIGSFKSSVTKQFRQRFFVPKQDLWQRGYFDHIVRSDRALLRIRQYIEDNPVKWHLDELNPRVN